jgi:hypothetical protein
MYLKLLADIHNVENRKLKIEKKKKKDGKKIERKNK